MTSEELSQRTVDFIDIVNDAVPPHKYKDNEDPKQVKIEKTTPSRGPLGENWVSEGKVPVMCSYKVVRTKFEVWGLQSRVGESTDHASIYVHQTNYYLRSNM